MFVDYHQNQAEFEANDKLRELFNKLYEDIRHGDKEHQLWLKDKLDNFLKEYLSESKE